VAGGRYHDRMSGVLASKRTVVVLASALAVPASVWLVWVGFIDPAYRPVAVTGTIQAKEIPVASKVGGRIARVFVQEGEAVTGGQPLVEFDIPELEARRDQLKSKIAEKEAQLLEYRHGPRPAEIDRARAAAGQALANYEMLQRGYRHEEVLKAQAQRKEAERNLALLEQGYRMEEVEQSRDAMEQARIQLEWAKRDWQRYEGLASQGAVSRRDAEDLRTKMDASQKAFEATDEAYQKMRAGPRADEIRAARERLNFAKHQEAIMLRGPRPEEIAMAREQYMQARAALDLLEQGTRVEQIARAEAELGESRAALDEVNAQIREKQIVSPAVCEVSVMDLHPGEVIPANKPVATLTRLDYVWTRIYIPERELSRVFVGQKVQVKVDAYPEFRFKGKVVQIPSVAEFTPRNVQTPEERSAQVFGVKVTIDNTSRLLRGGMNAEVTLPPADGSRGKLAVREIQ